jgi:hypothetical protein
VLAAYCAGKKVGQALKSDGRRQHNPHREELDIMSTNSANNGRRKVVVAPTVGRNTSVSSLGVIVVPIATCVVHLAIIAVAFFLSELLANARAVSEEVSEEEVQATTQVEDIPKAFDLTNTDLGTDDQVPLNYNVDRIEETSVPGQVDPTQSIGVPGAPSDAPKSNVPLPPGSGGGLGGAMPNLDNANIGGGFASLIGGMGGNYLGNQFAGRSGATRQKMLQEGGGNARSEASVASGLEWLALHQAQDGHWSLHEFNHSAREKPRPAGKIRTCNCVVGSTQRQDIAATGFGLLPFLAGGITHRPVKKTNKDYSKTVDGALNWLMSKQSKEGSYSGDMYAHGIATIAMCEAYGLTSDPRLKQSAQRALNFIAYAQDPAGGGWRYAPKQAGDTSVTGWQLMALKSGQMAGLSVSKNILKLSERFLDSCETSNKGGYGYTPGSGETITMTAVGLLCRQYSGVNPRNPGLAAGVKRLTAYPPGKLDNIYYLYYATQVMHHMQGESWRFWNEGMDENGKKIHSGIRDSLLSKQDKGATPKHPHQIGSWPGSQGGRIMATSLSLLCLEVYYRHLPLYRRDMTFTKDK